MHSSRLNLAFFLDIARSYSEHSEQLEMSSSSKEDSYVETQNEEEGNEEALRLSATPSHGSPMCRNHS
jgi:hypothetical protein